MKERIAATLSYFDYGTRKNEKMNVDIIEFVSRGEYETAAVYVRPDGALGTAPVSSFTERETEIELGG